MSSRDGESGFNKLINNNMKIFMLNTLQLIGSPNPKRADNIVSNSRVIERENKPPYFILNERRSN